MTEERIKSFQFRERMASMIEAAQFHPVVVTTRNDPTVVVISFDEYRRVKQFMYRTASPLIDQS